MEPRAFAAWDRLAVQGIDDPAHGYYGAFGPPARCLERTERYERATGDQVREPDAARALAADYAARVEAARARAGRPVQAAALFRRLLGLDPVFGNRARDLVLGIVVVLAVAAWGWSAVLPLALLVVAVGAAAIVQVYRRDRLGPALRALRAGACPDCGYDLSGAPAGLDLAATEGVNVGPRRCPECGVPWPLVPPPAPAD